MLIFIATKSISFVLQKYNTKTVDDLDQIRYNKRIDSNKGASDA